MFWRLNWVLILDWSIWNTTDYLYKMDLALNNLQTLICHKTQSTNQPTDQPTNSFQLIIPTFLVDDSKELFFAVLSSTNYF